MKYVFIQLAHKIEKIAARSPLWARFLAESIPISWILGKRYLQYRRRFYEKDNAHRLLKIVSFAINQVPYYKKKYESPPKTLVDFEEQIGFLDKEILRHQRDDLLSPLFNKNKYDEVTTSGSTGEPSVFYLPKDRFYKEWAYFHEIWSSKGYNGQLRAVLRNHRLSASEDYRLHIFRKELVFDAYRNHPEYYHVIWKTIRKFNIRYFQSYPHLAYNFFSYAARNQWDLSFIKGVFLSSEQFLPFQRKLLVEELGLPVLSVYGLSEKLALAVDWDGIGEYEIIESYGYVELIDENDKVIKTPGKEGEIVATTLDNYGMPLIRFRTGDISQYKEYSSHRRILNGISGRKGQYIFNPDGTGVSITSLNMHGKLLDKIEGIQYYQPTKGEVEIRIVPKFNFTEKDKESILQYFSERFHPAMKIRIKPVSKLQVLPNGKLLPLISEIKTNKIN